MDVGSRKRMEQVFSKTERFKTLWTYYIFLFFCIFLFIILFIPHTNALTLGKPQPLVYDNTGNKLMLISLPWKTDIKINNHVIDKSGLYKIDGELELIYEFPIRRWNANIRYISNNGEFIVTIRGVRENDLYVLKSGDISEMEILNDSRKNALKSGNLYFFKNGLLIKKYYFDNLVNDFSKIERGIKTHHWIKKIKANELSNELLLETVDNILYVFDIATGMITNIIDTSLSDQSEKVTNKSQGGKSYPKLSLEQLEFYRVGKYGGRWDDFPKNRYTTIDNNQKVTIDSRTPFKPTSSGRECEDRLAGYGKRAKAICYDFINSGWRGPLMVVVPTGGEFNNNFAIGKYEITVGDYSKYCTISKSCAPEEKKEKFNNPITGISLDEAKAYAVWLSDRTGKTYRLPTATEWEYAANAAGKQPKKDFNCRIVDDDKVTKGDGVVSIKSGQSNGWGLKNYIGNVQEWVIDGDSTKVRGGAYTDANDECDISLSRPHSGDADDITGFRIFMEM